jgi:hypothetical protein
MFGTAIVYNIDEYKQNNRRSVMKHLSSPVTLVALAVALILVIPDTTYAQDTKTQNGAGFVDENGDGYNDNAPDHDGDGIPNGRDDDYVGRGKGRGFVDEDGDGINDNAPDHDGDGIPNGQDTDYTGPKNRNGQKNQNKASQGTGTNTNLQKGQGTGQCDGTGPKGPRGGGSGQRKG